MEVGFFHKKMGYWQASSPPSQSVLRTYPDGTVKVPVRPSPFHEWDGSSWVEISAMKNEQATSAARAQRNALLAASDWTQIPDAPVDKVAWAAYRQALRDIPQQNGFPDSVTWPSKPE